MDSAIITVKKTAEKSERIEKMNGMEYKEERSAGAGGNDRSDRAFDGALPNICFCAVFPLSRLKNRDFYTSFFFFFF